MHAHISLLCLAPFALAFGGCSLEPTPSPELILGGATDYGGEESDDAGSTPAREPDASAPVHEAGADATSVPTVDEPAILTAINRGAFRDSPSFVHVTSTAYPSAVATGSTIDEWVSAIGADDYLAISPDGGAASADLPVGTTIVREVIDSTGAVTELTLLVKGPPGYNPTIGDWWWGVTDPNGVPEIVDGGDSLGRLTQCYSCHVPRQPEDFLFGAPLDDRNGGDVDPSRVVTVR
jgi:hypothetical protein